MPSVRSSNFVQSLVSVTDPVYIRSSSRSIEIQFRKSNMFASKDVDLDMASDVQNYVNAITFDSNVVCV